MKVVIYIEDNLNGSCNSSISDIVDWPFDILPSKGDCIEVDTSKKLFQKMKFSGDDAKIAIDGNVFYYVDKMFTYEKNEPVINLYFEPAG